MQAILTAALVLGFCGLAGAQGDRADPAGTWKCEYEIGGLKLTATLAIRIDGDKPAGTMSWPDQKDAKLEDVKLDGDTLTFSAVRKYEGEKFPLAFTLKLDGDRFKGKAASDFGGHRQEFGIEGKREKVADPVGTWNCEYEIGGRKLSATLTIRNDGDKPAGTMSWPDQKDAKLEDVKWNGDTLTFSVVRKYKDEKFPLAFTLKIDGDRFQGKSASDFGGHRQEFGIEGRRETKGR